MKGESLSVDPKEERILCAAIYYKNDKYYPHQPKGILNGFVICGRRHHNCISILSIMNLPKNVHIEQGFITNLDRFVDREEAFIIAEKTGQLLFKHKTGSLFSEDLY